MDVTMAHGAPGGMEMLIILMLCAFGCMALLVKTVLYCCMFAKAGYCWAMGLLMLVPFVNIIMPFVLAFGDWPVCRELRDLRMRMSVTPQSS